MRLALIIEYDGSRYHGFQYQVNAQSIQEELENALHRFLGVQTRVKGGGRTDAGVHARAQVVAFDTDSSYSPETFVKALNFYLPDDIAVKEAYNVRENFDPRRKAVSREYRYTILNSASRSPLMSRFACQLAQPLNVEAMRRAAKLFEGVRDFGAFCGPVKGRNTSTVRHVYKAEVKSERNLVLFDVEANAFLPHQVRRMAGALVQVGFGKMSEEDLQKIGPTGASHGALSMPPNGLCLMRINYKDFPPEMK